MKHLATLLFLFCVSACAFGQAVSTRPYQLLWEIRGPHSPQPSYLFGTMHVTDERVFALPDSVFLGIQNSPGFALEVDFDSASYLFLEYMYAAHGEAIFDEGTWKNTLKATKSWDGEAKRDFDPAELFKLFDRDEAHAEESTFLDAFLYRLAKEQGKNICGLEDLIDQMALIADPERMSTRKATSPSGSPQKRLRLNDMIDVYEVGDIEALYEMVNHGSTSDFFKDEVIIKRNYGMARNADSLMHLRPTFIGVGAAHLPGEEGVIALLRQRGYRLRPVVATYTGLADVVRQKDYVPQWTTFQRPSEGYRLKVAARPFPMEMMDGKLKMYLGMDFAGGLVFCYYSLSVPGEITADKMDNIGESLVNSFGKGSIEDDRDITYQGFPGKEYQVKKNGEHLRIRILFGNGKMYMLLLGNSKQVISSPAADTWFNSLEFFEPVPLSKQARVRHSDPINGFSIEMPDDFDYESHQVQGFPTGDGEPLYNKYEIEDGKHGQVIRILCEDFDARASMGELEDRMDECIRFMTGKYLDPIGEFQPLERDGVKGLSGTYDGEFLHYRLDCYQRYNRLFVFGTAIMQDAADSTAMDSIRNSVRFLPLPERKFSHPLVVDSLFKAVFPGKPTEWAMDGLPSSYRGRIDSVQVYFFHDPQTSLNTWVEYAHVWKYYAGGNQELYDAIAEQGDGKGNSARFGDPFFKDENFFNSEPDADSYLASIDGSWNEYLYNAEAGYTTVTRAIAAGNDVLVLHMQLPGDQASMDKEFEINLQPFAKELPNQKRSPQFANILNDMESDDSTVAEEAQAALRYYRIKRSEFDAAIAHYEKIRDGESFGPDEMVMDMLLKADDRTILPKLQALFERLPHDTYERLEILRALLLRDWEGAHDWAVAQLKADPTVLDHADPYFTWSSYLSDDSTGTRLQDIDFLLDIPSYALALAGDAATEANVNGLTYSSFEEKFASIAAQGIALRTFGTDHLYDDISIYQILAYLAEHDADGWQKMAHAAMRFEDGFLPGSVFTMLAERGEMPSQKELRHVLEIRTSRDQVYQWLLEVEHADAIKGKYRKPDYMAAVALDLALEDYPEQVELIEKRKIYFDGYEQWLYIYRFAFEGERDWTLGFAGPIPTKGLPSTLYLPLSGSNYDPYSPTTYKKKTKAWIKEMSAENEE